ncbi:PadR family transcriptional regulator [Lapidilactobacillus bayanensis]|uniref:PadR family transcriptional regulator n=1 Tax=Lapidilactobacillus bayanensis TaxID=2485998 RepID=UPI000F77DB28|nr:PadR family transcriptional regulator [Lapidilactobacillus bayanensis]
MAGMTEMLKGLLEGIILQIISKGETYGYEITNHLKEAGFNDISEGTVYTVLLRLEKQKSVSVEKRKSDKGPMRKFYRLTNSGEQARQDFWTRWQFIMTQIQQIKGE